MRFILGNFGSGKTTKIIKEASELLKSQNPVLIIVPSRQHKDYLLKELLKSCQGIVGNPVITLGEFQQILIENIFPIPSQRPESVTNFSKFLIISSICTRHAKEFKVFHQLPNRPELMKMVYRLVNTLRDKDIDTLSFSPELQDKIYDIQLILSYYQEYLKNNNLTDSKFQIDLICSSLSLLKKDLFPQYIFVDGFFDYTATQFKLISSSMQYFESLGNSVAITLSRVPHILGEQSEIHFRDMFPNAELDILESTQESTSLSDSFLEEKPFTQSNLSLYEIQAFGNSKEVEYIINQIKKLCIEENYKLEDILLITNKQDQYLSILSSAFRKANIPFSFGKDDKLSQNPLIIFIKKLIKMMTEGLTHESLEFLSQSNYIKQDFQRLWSKAVILLPFVVEGRKESWQKAFQQQKEFLKSRDDYNEAVFDELKALEESMLTLCECLYSSDFQGNRESISEVIQRVVSVLEFLGIQDRLIANTPFIKHKSIIEHSIAKDYAALLKLKEIFVELQSSLEGVGQDSMTLNNFLFFFTMITEETRYRSEIPQSGVVRVLTPNDARGVFAKSVFILGLNEGGFPSTPKLEIFDNFERSQLNLLSKKILGLPLWDTDIDYFSEQKLLFATAISRGLEKIFFSRTPVNEKGVYFNISHFLKRIIDKQVNYTRIPSTNVQMLENPSIFYKKHQAHEYYELSHLVFLKKSHSDIAEKAYEYTQKIAKANDIFDDSQKPAQDMREFFGDLSNLERIKNSYIKDKIRVSPTRLERFGRCRYQGLWQKVWDLRPYKLPTYKPEAADYGTLYHKVLETYLREQSGKEYSAPLLKKILDESIVESQQSRLFLLDKHFIFVVLQNFLKNIQPSLQAKQAVKYLELSSGEGELPNQIIPLGEDKSLQVFSRIDRVDSDLVDGSYSVIDYKKGGASSYKGYQRTPFNLFQGFLYGELLNINQKTPLNSISYVFLEKQEIFEEYPGSGSKKKYFESLGDFRNFKYLEITRLLSLLGEGDFSPYTLEQDIGKDLIDLYSDKFGENFDRENTLKCAYCDLQKICLRKNKKLRSF